MKRGLFALLAVLSLGIGAGSAAAASQVIVTPTQTQGWSTADTRPGGSVTFVADATAPGSPNRGALQLTTDLTTSAKAQYLHAASTPLARVTELSYYTKQISAPFPEAAASYQLITNLLGTSGFTTFVFEPYQNPLQGPVVNNVWQSWDVGQGLFWSTRTVACSNGTIVGTPGGPATYTLAQIKSTCPGAVVIGFGVNIGTFNPGYVVRTDLFNFNGTVYNFEPDSTKPGCADGQGVFQDRGNHGGDGPKTHECKNGHHNEDDGESSDSEE